MLRTVVLLSSHRRGAYLDVLFGLAPELDRCHSPLAACDQAPPSKDPRAETSLLLHDAPRTMELTAVPSAGEIEVMVSPNLALLQLYSTALYTHVSSSSPGRCHLHALILRPDASWTVLCHLRLSTRPSRVGLNLPLLLRISAPHSHQQHLLTPLPTRLPWPVGNGPGQRSDVVSTGGAKDWSTGSKEVVVSSLAKLIALSAHFGTRLVRVCPWCSLKIANGTGTSQIKVMFIALFQSLIEPQEQAKPSTTSAADIPSPDSTSPSVSTANGQKRTLSQWKRQLGWPFEGLLKPIVELLRR